MPMKSEEATKISASRAWVEPHVERFEFGRKSEINEALRFDEFSEEILTHKSIGGEFCRTTFSTNFPASTPSLRLAADRLNMFGDPLI